MSLRMATRTSALLTALTVVVGAIPLSVAAEDLSPRQLRTSAKKASKHWRAGRVAEALPLYEQVLAATEPGAKVRADGLYALVLTSLAPGFDHDPARARELLAELEGSFPHHPRRLEIRTLAGFLRAADAADAEGRRLQDRVARLEADFERRRLEAESGHAAEVAMLTEKLEAMEQRLEATRGELASTRQDLANKEEALQKLTERVVGRSAGRN